MSNKERGAGFAIEMHERYRDVARDQWPISIDPQPDEALSSWLHRLALANGIAPRAFAAEIGQRGGMWSARLEDNLPIHVAALLGKQTGLPDETISVMAFNDDVLGPLLLPRRLNADRRLSTWMQYCSLCLGEDEAPYFRRQWRLSSRISCFVHRRGLRDRCPSCRIGLASFDQSELVPQHFCARCSFDLRTAASPSVKSAARRLDYAIADMLRVEAAKGAAAANDLVQRVLRAPDIANVSSAKTIVSLSASARVRCFERLASRSHDWLTSGCGTTIAYRRGMILAAGSHEEWIMRCADFLERSMRSPRRKRSLSPNANSTTLFTAYLRIMSAGD